ncbi:unnamed protein product [Adineta steineri]|uniref:Uncharacterized protein n=1 Tax=Adineta steineri TaxID=433720 RepID=A0A814A487_9BILA|nr:unnamed protein product [Adineta steineri]
MIGRPTRRIFGRRCISLINVFFTVTVVTVIFINRLLSTNGSSESATKPPEPTTKLLDPIKTESVYTYENFAQLNESLCSKQSTARGPNQKIIALSIYGSTSKFTDNPMFSWDTSIFPFLKPLVNEIKVLLPSWIIRIYIDFTGSTQSQKTFLYSLPNVDICDMHSLPVFGAKLLDYLPGKMWRFTPVLDPFVDYFLSRDVDSPMVKRETETINIWLSDEHEKKIFHILRDHKQHGISILGGLWGAAPGRARRELFDIFFPLLIPSIARKYNGSGDQDFLGQHVWEKVRSKALMFDSYFCRQYRGSRPFPTERPRGNCYLGCIRPCCINATDTDPIGSPEICPPACRPKDHQNWLYC